MNCHFYGLPDASRAYYKAYSTLLIANGYKQSMVDGIEITSIISDGSLLLRQSKLINDLLTEFPRRTYAHQTSTPQTHHPIHRTTLDNISSTKYQHLLGILIHLTKTRIEISMAVSKKPWLQLLKNLPLLMIMKIYYKLLIICMHEYPDTGLIIKKHSTDPLQLYCHVDASYLLHPDARSHSGYSLSFSPSGPAFFCKSKKQQLVATSAMHAETRALYQLTLQIIQLHLVAIEIYNFQLSYSKIMHH
eukprot:gene16464-22456_t